MSIGGIAMISKHATIWSAALALSLASVACVISLVSANDRVSPPFGPRPDSRSGATAMNPSAAS